MPKSNCNACLCRDCDTLAAGCDVPCLSKMGCDSAVNGCTKYVSLAAKNYQKENEHEA